MRDKKVFSIYRCHFNNPRLKLLSLVGFFRIARIAFFPSSDNLPTSTTQQVLRLHLKEGGRNLKIKLAQCISMIMYNNNTVLPIEYPNFVYEKTNIFKHT